MGMGDFYMRFDILGPRVTLKIKENCLEEKNKPTNFHLWPFVMVLLVCASCLVHIHFKCNLSFEHTWMTIHFLIFKPNYF
jgi:hypothetical protein